VTEDPPQAARTAGALDEALLDAKLSVPQIRPGFVSRAELIESARASDCRVVGVTAPAGYGKSTFLVEWAHAEDRRVGWVSLDRFDDDPAVLLTLLASAYARTSSGNADLVADVSGVGVSVLGRAAPRLACVTPSTSVATASAGRSPCSSPTRSSLQGSCSSYRGTGRKRSPSPASTRTPLPTPLPSPSPSDPSPNRGDPAEPSQ